MNNITQTQTQTRTGIDTVTVPYALPMLLAVNTFALVALEHLGGIPVWIKSAVAVFLSF
jgi:hypothetical protein